MKTALPRLFVAATEFEIQALAREICPNQTLRFKLDPAKRYLFADDPDGAMIFIASGMGLEAAENGLESALARFGPVQSVVCVGLAGGLVKTLQTGHMVLPSRVLWQREEEVPTEWLRMSLVSFAGATPLKTLVTMDHVISTPIDKSALYAATGAEAVDMETAMWGRVCRQHGIPWVTLRTVMDRVEDTLPEFLSQISDRYGRPVWMKVLLHFLSHPHHVGVALRIQRQAQKAAKAYAAVIASWMESHKNSL